MWVHHASDDVERFKQDLDEGLIEGIPPAISDPEWLTYYLVDWHGQLLRDGQKFSEYGVPEGDMLELHVKLVHPDSIVTRRIV